MKHQVIVAEETPLFRKGLATILTGTEKFHFQKEAACLSDLIPLLEAHSKSIFVIDTNLPGLNSLSGIKKITTSYKDCKILAIGKRGALSLSANSLIHGAVGYLEREADPEEFITALSEVADKGYYLPKQTLQSLIQISSIHQKSKKTTPTKPKDSFELTDKHLKILEFLRKGMTSRVIGEKLHLSTKTVDTMRQEMYRQFDAKGCTKLVIYAMEHGLIDV